MRDSAFPYMKMLGPLPFTPSPAFYINYLDDIRAFTTPSPLTTMEVS
jgi:hypothetical protein